MSVSSANAAPRVNRARWPTYVDATAKRSNGLGDSERRGAYHMVYAMSGSAHLLRSGHHPDARESQRDSQDLRPRDPLPEEDMGEEYRRDGVLRSEHRDDRDVAVLDRDREEPVGRRVEEADEGDRRELRPRHGDRAAGERR